MNFKKIISIFILITLTILSVYLYTSNNSSLTSEEIKFIKNHPVLYIAPDPLFAPVEFIDDNGNYTGIAADYLKWISEKYHLNIQVVRYETWDKILKALKSKEADIIGAAVKTKEREKFLTFTSPYIEIDNVILTKTSYDTSKDITSLKDKKVLSIKGYAVNEYINKKYPFISLTLVPDIKMALTELTIGNADAIILDVSQASYYIKKLNLTNIKLAYQIDYNFKLSFAVRKDYPELVSILEKGINDMPENTRDEIITKWISIGTVKNIYSKKTILGVIISILILLILLLLFVQWNHALKKNVALKTRELLKELEYRKKIEKELLTKNKKFLETNELLIKTKNELEELNKDLNAKVERRTKLLNMTNRELELSMFNLQNKQFELEETNHKLNESLKNLEKTQNQLLETEKQASLSRIVAGISHEINTPIGIAKTAITYTTKELLLLKNLFENRKLTKKNFKEIIDTNIENSNIILNNLDTAINIINRFKEISVDNTTMEKRKFELTEYIDNIVLNLKPLTKKHNVKLKYIKHEKIEVNTFPSAITQIITNLTMNSINHGFENKKNGHIKITTKLLDNSKVELIYTDDGKGISKENQKKIFEPFFTTKRGRGGMGLGMNIIYNIINTSLEGDIKLESDKNGVKFIIHFPNNI